LKSEITLFKVKSRHEIWQAGIPPDGLVFFDAFECTFNANRFSQTGVNVGPYILGKHRGAPVCVLGQGLDVGHPVSGHVC